jgi:hypothetical protein
MRAFFMGGPKTERWQDPYIQTLQPNGRLVLAYAQDQIAADKQIIMEDAALETGVELSEIETYLSRFVKAGKLQLVVA